ncbi:hypothetical protein TRVL_03531 [Trypanosoma vivax]|nr:hypothetical protein TRVL_03531 [Trypanosoma vivax]
MRVLRRFLPRALTSLPHAPTCFFLARSAIAHPCSFFCRACAPGPGDCSYPFSHLITSKYLASISRPLSLSAVVALCPPTRYFIVRHKALLALLRLSYCVLLPSAHSPAIFPVTSRRVSPLLQHLLLASASATTPSWHRN